MRAYKLIDPDEFHIKTTLKLSVLFDKSKGKIHISDNPLLT